MGSINNRVFCKFFARFFIIVHLYFLIKNLLVVFSFFNHFSSLPAKVEGLGAILHAGLNASCIFLGLCLYVGEKRSDRSLLSVFIQGIIILTVGSLVYLILISIFSHHISVFGTIAASLHVGFYIGILFAVKGLHSTFPRKEPPAPDTNGNKRDAESPSRSATMQLDVHHQLDLEAGERFGQRQDIIFIIVKQLNADLEELKEAFFKRFDFLGGAAATRDGGGVGHKGRYNDSDESD